jgi:hypothetical protein
MVVVQDAPANSKDHRPMTAHQRGERGFLLAMGKAPEAVGVG